jgi:predicted nucleic acid-binding protein
VECLRTLDRLRLRGALSENDLAVRLAELHRALRRIEFVALSAPVLERAGAPFPTSLGTLDAIHLASALVFRESEGVEPVFVTHDEDLARGAIAMGFEVAGA